ncbi:Rap1a/Tai family immunity protein [Oricola indica]|uniref:Rap1a/Tai family immunity protein n=1 Tax=Oricola indica TaxID=2872591 RepID=UPI003CCB7C25
MRREAGLFLALFVSLTMIANKASASFYDGNELIKYCRADDATAGSWFCMGYIASVIDVVESSTGITERFPVCLPGNVKLGQIVDVVKKYLETHPEIRHQPAAYLTIDALQEVWRC